MCEYETICACCGPQTRAGLPLCPTCGGRPTFRYAYDAVKWDDRLPRSLWRCWHLLPVKPTERLVNLDEGGTPLLRSRSCAARRLWLKDETRNPTGSHKDRVLALGTNHALAVGAGVSAVVSAGSTRQSHVAYAARAGLTHLALMSADTPVERAHPVFALGTKIVMVDASIDPIIETLDAARQSRFRLTG
jgi:threonine synthase